MRLNYIPPSKITEEILRVLERLKKNETEEKTPIDAKTEGSNEKSAHSGWVLGEEL